MMPRRGPCGGLTFGIERSAGRPAFGITVPSILQPKDFPRPALRIRTLAKAGPMAGMASRPSAGMTANYCPALLNCVV